MRFVSFIFSLGLHALLLVCLVYFPSKQKMIKLNSMVYQVEVVSLPKVKKKVTIKKVLKKGKVKRGSEVISIKKRPILLPKKVIEKRPIIVEKRKKTKRIEKKIAKIPSKKKILEEVLKEIEKKAKIEEKYEEVVSKEIAEIEKKITTGSVKEEGESSKLLVYKEVVKEVIKKNWRLVPSKEFEKLSAEVKLFIDKNGKILDFFFVKRSGNREFDSSVIKAIEETKRLPAPPLKVDDITITFDVKDLWR